MLKQLTDIGMQLPWLVGGSWSFGGAHTNTGSGTYPLGSMDYSRWESWGEPVLEDVVASHRGEIKIHSSCNMEIVMDGTWSTTYYHMDHLMYETGDVVERNEPVGKYADNEAQAFCDGGTSTGPHVHWTLKENGQERHLLDVVISGWTVHPGDDSYDADCDRMYFHRDEEIHCPYHFIENEGVPDDGDTETGGGNDSDSDDLDTDSAIDTASDDDVDSDSDGDVDTDNDSGDDDDDDDDNDDDDNDDDNNDDDNNDDNNDNDNNDNNNDDSSEGESAIPSDDGCGCSTLGSSYHGRFFRFLKS